MKVPKLISIILFNESRKVCFGVWLYGTTTIMLFQHLLTSDQWMLCMAFASALVGGGTIADTWLNLKKGGDNQNAPAKPA